MTKKSAAKKDKPTIVDISDQEKRKGTLKAIPTELLRTSSGNLEFVCDIPGFSAGDTQVTSSTAFGAERVNVVVSRDFTAGGSRARSTHSSVSVGFDQCRSPRLPVDCHKHCRLEFARLQLASSRWTNHLIEEHSIKNGGFNGG